MKISDLPREFQRRKTHMAVCVDGYGGTTDVAIFEGVIEEIVGESHQDYDVDEEQHRRVGDTVVADGRVSGWDLEETLGIRFPMHAGLETRAGFLTARLGIIRERGMQAVHGGRAFVVKEAAPTRVEVVEVVRPVC